MLPACITAHLHLLQFPPLLLPLPLLSLHPLIRLRTSPIPCTPPGIVLKPPMHLGISLMPCTTVGTVLKSSMSLCASPISTGTTLRNGCEFLASEEQLVREKVGIEGGVVSSVWRVLHQTLQMLDRSRDRLVRLLCA